MSPEQHARIAHVGPEPFAGGMSAVIRDMRSSRLGERYQLDLIVSYRTAHRVRRLLSFLGSLGALVVWCLRPGPRLVHVHTAIRGSIYRKAVLVAAASATGRPVVLHLHAGAGDIDAFAARLRPLSRRLLGAGVRRADRVISVSGAGGERFMALFGLDAVTVVPNAAPEPREPVEGAPEGGAGGPRVLFMGGFKNPAKGGQVMLRAMPELLAAVPGVELVLTGSGSPPPELLALPGRDGRVRWEGWVEGDTKERLLASCDVFAMPSLSEGLPVALLEAMSHGRAIVATDVGGIPEVVRHDQEALLVPAGDAAALGAALIRLAEDPALRERLGRAGRERVRRFGRDEVYAQVASIYDELLSARARG
jgi:glycosyltransferase involved in cell wall biosynthesis